MVILQAFRKVMLMYAFSTGIGIAKLNQPESHVCNSAEHNYGFVLKRRVSSCCSKQKYF